MPIHTDSYVKYIQFKLLHNRILTSQIWHALEPKEDDDDDITFVMHLRK